MDLSALAKSLYQRRHAAVVVPYEPRMMNWEPVEHACHNNTDRYVRENPGCKTIRGWLVFDFTLGASIGWPPFFRFTAHSVVEDADGRLFDLTPSKASQRYPFLQHERPASEFDAFVAAVTRTSIIRCEAGCFRMPFAGARSARPCAIFAAGRVGRLAPLIVPLHERLGRRLNAEISVASHLN